MTSNAFIRRELDAIARQNDQAMRLQSEALTRMVETGDLDAEQTDQFVTGGLGRRGFLRLGGMVVAASAVFAACGSSKTGSPKTPTGPGASTSVTAVSASTDVTILRTASSLEALAVLTYQKAIATGLLSAPVTMAAKNFMDQHQQHAMAFQAATTKAGGTPFSDPNPVVNTQVILPALAKVKTQSDIVHLAYTLESAASQTYQNAIGAFSSGPNASSYNMATASILGVESRHLALLGIVLGEATMYPPYPENGFQTDNNAVLVGTGV